MEQEKVAQENAAFYIVAVGMSLGMEYFVQAVLCSHLEESQFPTDNVGRPGYIKINTSAVWQKGEDHWQEFLCKIREGLLARASYEFSSRIEFEGDFAEKVKFEKDGYSFDFCIKEYERDMSHKFEIVGPEKIPEIPEEEKIGRVVYLTIAPIKN